MDSLFFFLIKKKNNFSKSDIKRRKENPFQELSMPLASKSYSTWSRFIHPFRSPLFYFYFLFCFSVGGSTSTRKYLYSLLSFIQERQVRGKCEAAWGSQIGSYICPNIMYFFFFLSITAQFIQQFHLYIHFLSYLLPLLNFIISRVSLYAIICERCGCYKC